MNYSVQQAADKMGLTTYTLRYYDNHGMLPYVKRDENNNRIFDDVDLEWVQIIICLRETGMPLKKIQHYLQLVVQGEQTVPERYQIMLEQQQQTLAEINELNQHLVTINKKVAHYADILINKKPDSYEPSNIANKNPQSQPQKVL
ncbi:MerR family transcriptional regulator [Bombilactobacillus bombi]|uniref:MerR family transcriptional regulator n=1 Tax=Bombilactobacillus bombi TaxID=1303590 RepID=UPI0015E5C702|nr:MerR family transcriptional regulator [Bombilactobacillus bombi]MBA1433936.1 MerR family transcriptional regulator [Bombilactobacillus bombi]